MDGSRFDDLTRALAGSASRRRLFGRLVGGAAALLGPSETTAEPRRCRKPGQKCLRGGKDKGCCTGECCANVCCAEGEQCVEGGCCPLGQSCGDLCCPPENVGCIPAHAFPDGTVVPASCVCPAGFVYRDGACLPCAAGSAACGDEAPCCDTGSVCHPETKTCVLCLGFGLPCVEADDCCHGTCCDGRRCPLGEYCFEGMCQRCPRGAHCSNTITCGRHSTVGVCCEFPAQARCCCDSAPGANDGWAVCCFDDCPPCPFGRGGQADTQACTEETFPLCCYVSGEFNYDFECPPS